MSSRYERHYGFFGREAQERMHSMDVAVVGVGGTGSHVVQQLAYLGVGRIRLIDDEELDETNLNRYVTARHDDSIPGSPKVDLAKRLIERVNPGAAVTTIDRSFLSTEGYEAVKEADAVFGCVDNDGVRFVLNELCCAYERPLFDIASGIPTASDYGGRVHSVLGDKGCLVCREVLDIEEVSNFLESADQRAAREGIYGVPDEDLDGSGPSVVSINGVVASLGVTEFMVWATGIRAPVARLSYHGRRGIVSKPMEDDGPLDGCYYCSVLRGQGDTADVERYLRKEQPSRNG